MRSHLVGAALVTLDEFDERQRLTVQNESSSLRHAVASHLDGEGVAAAHRGFDQRFEVIEVGGIRKSPRLPAEREPLRHVVARGFAHLERHEPEYRPSTVEPEPGCGRTFRARDLADLRLADRAIRVRARGQAR